MSMNWGVRGALLTSDHFGASGEVKLRFSAAPGLDPWHGVLGVVQRRLRGPGAIDLASIAELIATYSLAAACEYVLVAAVAQPKGSCCI